MGTILHTALPNADLHEPKGASTASNHEILVSTGSGATDFVAPSKIGMVNAVGNITTTMTVNLNLGDIHTYTLTDNVATVTISNTAAGGNSWTLILTQDGTGSRTVTWPAAVKWAAGTAPTLSTGAADVDIITMFTPDNGTTIYAFASGLNMS